MSMWWLTLPVLLLPVWWHRQKRERIKAMPLATARFLPRAEPQQLRVWRWTERLLLVVRCLLLVAVMAVAATLAALSERRLERPLRRWSQRRLKRAG